MVTLALAAVLVGGALGLCFRVWVLLPVALAAIFFIAISGVAGQMSLPLIAQRCLLAVLTLQAGYCVGLATRHIALIARAPSFRKAIAEAKRSRFSRV